MKTSAMRRLYWPLPRWSLTGSQSGGTVAAASRNSSSLGVWFKSMASAARARSGVAPTAFTVDQLHTAWTEDYGWYDYPLSHTNISTIPTPSIGWVDIDVTAAVNSWLAEHPGIRVVDIRQSTSGGSFAGPLWLLSVWYEEPSETSWPVPDPGP